MKILLLAGHSRRAFKWGMVGEAAKRIMEDAELYYLDCNNVPKGYCGTQHKIHPFYCNKCRDNCLKVIKYAGVDSEHILKMTKFKNPKFPKFDTAKKATEYCYDKYNIGLGASSCIMTISKDYNYDTKKWKKSLDDFLRTEYQVIRNLEELQEKYHFDEIHTFNGRMPYMHAATVFAGANNIPFVIYESASNKNRISVLKNIYLHNFYHLKQFVKYTYEKPNHSKEEKDKIGSKWYSDRRAGVVQSADYSFTADQIRDSLPSGFDFEKENIAFFNSSIDEVYAFEGWEHPFADNENDVLEGILEHYRDDKNKHFYVRIHPNLKRAKVKKTTQYVQLKDLEEKFDNLTVIDPDVKIDTYALIQASSKVVTAYSTVGAEATYWGKPSILAGKAPYEDFDCVYIPHSFDELFELIDDKNLKPKPKENSYPYGYFNHEFGEDCKYFIRTAFCEGDFCGMHIVSK